MKRFENYSSPPRHTSSWNVTGRVLVSANAFRILLTRAWNLSALRSLLYFPSSRIIRKHGANSWIYALVLYKDPSATLDDLCEAVTTLEEIERIARRVLGGAHPITTGIGGDLQNARAVLHAREMS